MKWEQEMVSLCLRACEEGPISELKNIAIVTTAFAVFRKKKLREMALRTVKEYAEWWLSRYRTGARHFREDHPRVARFIGATIAVVETTGSYILSLSLALMALFVAVLSFPLAIQSARGFFGAVIVTSLLLVGSLWYLFEAERWRRKELTQQKSPASAIGDEANFCHLALPLSRMLE